MKPVRVDLRPEGVGLMLKEADSGSVKADMRLEWASFMHERADLRLESARLRPERSNLRSERTNLRPARAD